jgi:hypothetical protein
MLFPNLNEPEKHHLFSGLGVEPTYLSWLFPMVPSSLVSEFLSGRQPAQR